MNSSICSADATTHLKIVATALVAAIVIVWIGIAARGSTDGSAATMPSVAPAIAGPSMLTAIETARL